MRNAVALALMTIGGVGLLTMLCMIVSDAFAQDHPRPAAQCPEAPSVRHSMIEGGAFVAHTLEFSVDGKTWAGLPASTTWPRYWIREKVGELVIRRWEVVR